MRKKQTTTQYLQVTPDVLRAIGQPAQQPKREKRETGHMTEYFVWPVALSVVTPLFFAIPLVGVSFVAWSFVSWATGWALNVIPWQLWPGLFTVAYLWRVYRDSEYYFWRVTSQWAGKKKLAQLARTKTGIVQHKRLPQYEVNPRGSRPGRVIGDIFSDLWDRIAPRKRDDADADIPDEHLEEYRFMMAAYTNHDGFTRDTFNDMTGYQRMYGLYIPQWLEAGLIERVKATGGYKFIVGLDVAVERQFGILPHSGTGEPNSNTGEYPNENERTNEGGK